MAEAKLEIKVGSISFTGEGEGKWVSEQLDKVLEKIPDLSRIAPGAVGSGSGNGIGSGVGAGAIPKATGTLAAFLKAKNATTSQVRKFLATGVWLHDGESKSRLTTSDVSKALSDNNQGRLNNAADCLLKNISKGFCVKDGNKQFYVTEEGRADIG